MRLLSTTVVTLFTTLLTRLHAQSPVDNRVILVTFDGVRTEELFGGMDSAAPSCPSCGTL